MAFSKEHLYSPDEQITSGFAHAFSYAGRINILNRLHSEGTLCVEAIAESHPISKITLSDHLKTLRVCHLVTWEEKFPYTFYSVDPKNMEQACDYMARFLEKFRGK